MSVQAWAHSKPAQNGEPKVSRDLADRIRSERFVQAKPLHRNSQCSSPIWARVLVPLTAGPGASLATGKRDIDLLPERSIRLASRAAAVAAGFIAHRRARRFKTKRHWFLGARPGPLVGLK